MATMNTSMTDRRHLPDRRSAMQRVPDGFHMSALDWIAMALLIIGGLNWGLIGLFGINLVASLFGEESLISRVIYLAAGLAALYSLYLSNRMAQEHAKSRTV